MAASSHLKHKAAMEEVDVVLRRFGDEQSTLLDRFERLSFEVQLNRAILGRSLSEPSEARSSRTLPRGPSLVTAQVRQGRRGSTFNKVLKKLLKPILRRKKTSSVKNEVPDCGNFNTLKAFSRSLRV